MEVEDDGAGFEWKELNTEREEEREYFSGTAEEREDQAKRSHIGIRSIRFRIGIISNGTLRIESKPGKGTKVTVTFPKKRRAAGGDEVQ